MNVNKFINKFIKLLKRNWLLILIIIVVGISVYLATYHFDNINDKFTNNKEVTHQKIAAAMKFISNSQTINTATGNPLTTNNTLSVNMIDDLRPLDDCDKTERTCDFVRGKDCASCVNFITGEISQMTNIRNPKCPEGSCLIKHPNQCYNMKTALQCDRITSPFNIVDTDCSFLFETPSIGKGVYMMKNGSEPVLNYLNKELNENNSDCRIRPIIINNTMDIMPPMRTREQVSLWLQNNKPNSDFYNPCSPELNNGEISIDCAQQLYIQYNGKEKGTLNPYRPGNMISINREFNGSVKEFERHMKSLQ
jgi:hypothetical protein